MPTSALPEAQVESQDRLDSRSDLQLIADINGGDPAAFEVLYLRHRDWVVGLALRFTRNEDLALDVMQETFLYFLKKFPGFKLTANLKTFFYPAVKHISLAARRKMERYQSGDDEQNLLENLPANPTSASSELSIVLAQLPEEQRDVLLLRFVDGLSLAEIAAAMSIPLGTVKSRMHTALGSLRADPRTREFFEP